MSARWRMLIVVAVSLLVLTTQTVQVAALGFQQAWRFEAMVADTNLGGKHGTNEVYWLQYDEASDRPRTGFWVDVGGSNEFWPLVWPMWHRFQWLGFGISVAYDRLFDEGFGWSLGASVGIGGYIEYGAGGWALIRIGKRVAATGWLYGGIGYRASQYPSVVANSQFYDSHQNPTGVLIVIGLKDGLFTP